MADFEFVARTGDIPPGEGRSFSVNGRMVAVFHLDGEFHAINDTCPHMGASLASGYVEDEAVYCPWHAWRFCVKDGTWLDNPKASLKTDCYDVKVENDGVYIHVPDPPPRTPPADD